MADVDKPIGIIIRAFQVSEEAATDGARRRAAKVINDYAKEVASGGLPGSVKIKQISVVGTDDDHTIFGLGDDYKPYAWHGGTWVECA